MWSGTANDLAITAIIGPKTLTKLTNNQTPRIIGETKVLDYSVFSFILHVLMQKTEKRLKNPVLIPINHQTSNFELFFSSLDRFSFRSFTTRQFLNWKLSNGSDFESSTCNMTKFVLNLFSENRQNFWKILYWINPLSIHFIPQKRQILHFVLVLKRTILTEKKSQNQILIFKNNKLSGFEKKSFVWTGSDLNFLHCVGFSNQLFTVLEIYGENIRFSKGRSYLNLPHKLHPSFSPSDQ